MSRESKLPRLLPHVQINFRDRGYCDSARSFQPFLEEPAGTEYIQMTPVFPTLSALAENKQEKTIEEWLQIMKLIEAVDMGFAVNNPSCSSYEDSESNYEKYHHARKVDLRWRPVRLDGIYWTSEIKYRLNNPPFAATLDRCLDEAWLHDAETQLATESYGKYDYQDGHLDNMREQTVSNMWCWVHYTDDLEAPAWWRRLSGSWWRREDGDATSADMQHMLNTYGQYLTADVYAEALLSLPDPDQSPLSRKVINNITSLRQKIAIYTPEQWKAYIRKLRGDVGRVWMASLMLEAKSDEGQKKTLAGITQQVFEEDPSYIQPYKDDVKDDAKACDAKAYDLFLQLCEYLAADSQRESGTQFQVHRSKRLAVYTVSLRGGFLYIATFTLHRQYVGLSWEFWDAANHARITHWLRLPVDYNTILSQIMTPLYWEEKEYTLRMGFRQPRFERSRIYDTYYHPETGVVMTTKEYMAYLQARKEAIVSRTGFPEVLSDLLGF